MHAGMGHPQDYRLEDFLARTNQANTSPRGCSPTDIRRRCATERSGAIPPVCTALKPIKHPVWLHCVQHWELSLDVVNYPSNVVVYWHLLPHTPSLRCATGCGPCPLCCLWPTCSWSPLSATHTYLLTPLTYYKIFNSSSVVIRLKVELGVPPCGPRFG